ncbi:hypothetical protein M3Y97_00609400 [Aphelenchoides bicaudatus]|nr:hypothetical protein M3Y97_00609400 [Aphelenchoides bicaudatus]
MLTRNNQQPVSAPLIPIAAPTIYRAPDPNAPIYLSGPNAQQPPVPSYQTTTFRPSQQLSSDLSRIPKTAQANPYSERDKLFGIKPLVDPRANQPFNVSPNLFNQQAFGFSNFSTTTMFTNLFNGHLHVYPAKVDHVAVGAVGAPIQHNTRPQIEVPLTPIKTDWEIARFETNLNRFASDSDVQQKQRFVLPMDLANAPIESFLRRIEPNKPAVIVRTQSANANTRILTSNINFEERPTTMRTPLGQGHTLPPDQATPFTTYPDYRENLFPELINHAHDDKRPSTGRRVGPQGRFGGGTNEFKEDLGIMTYGINDQRRPWEKPPGRFGLEPTNRPPNAGYKDVALETLRATENRRPDPSDRLDQDLSKTQPFSQISYSKYDKDFPEVITPTPRSRETTTVIGVPLYPEFGIGYHGRSGNGPANKFIGAGINAPENGARIRIEEVSAELDDGIRPYRGPEEITKREKEKTSRKSKRSSGSGNRHHRPKRAKDPKSFKDWDREDRQKYRDITLFLRGSKATQRQCIYHRQTIGFWSKFALLFKNPPAHAAELAEYQKQKETHKPVPETENIDLPPL